MRVNSIFLLLLLLALATLISNYRIFQVYVGQEKILEIISSGEYQFDESYRDRISSGYPSVSSTVIPFKSILGAHWIVNDSIDKGLKLLKESNNDNPYLGFNDLIYANLFEEVGMKDSFTYYARKAVSKLPNAPQHYILLVKTFLMQEKYDSLDYVFNKIKNRVNDFQVWKVYLASVLRNIDKMDRDKIIANAEYAKKRFNHEEINLLSDYIIYGEKEVNQLIKNKQIAIDTFTKNPDYGIKLMKNILEKDQNIFHYETLIEMYFKNQEYQDVVDTYLKLIELNQTELRAVIVEFISISYINTNNLQSGCFLANQLVQAKYNISPSVALACNINQ